jgi:FKBP-type peptidyl-prolyl cis-trans isomerase
MKISSLTILIATAAIASAFAAPSFAQAPAATKEAVKDTAKAAAPKAATKAKAADAKPAAATATAATAATAAAASASKIVTTPSGLKYEDLVVGKGDEAKAGQIAVVHYTGWLWDGAKRGSKFDSSVDRGQPFEFPLGQGRVIKGWDEGVQGMKPGGKRVLTIPPELGYGARGAGGVIPPNATLQFEVEYISAR